MHLTDLRPDGNGLMKRSDVKRENVAMVITACCVLHDIFEIHGEEFNNTWLVDIDDDCHNFSQPENRR